MKYIAKNKKSAVEKKRSIFLSRFLKGENLCIKKIPKAGSNI